MTRPFSRVFCIANPAAGVRRGVRVAVEKALVMAGVDFAIRDTTGPGHGTALARQAVSQGADLVVAVGGDGTVNEVGRALVGGDVPMGVVPAGSGNAFARALGISLRPRKAVFQALSGQVLALDAGRVGEEVFFCSLGIGLDAEVVRRYNARTGKRRGLLPYVWLTLKALRSFQPESVRVVLDEVREVALCPLVLAVANTAQYGNGAIIAPGAVPDDGVLDVCSISQTNRLILALNAGRLFAGTIDRMPGVEVFRVRKLRIERASGGYFHVDGEAREGPASLAVEVMPGALKVALPKKQ